MDSRGEMGYRSPRLKAAREERKKEVEMELDGEAPQVENAEIQSPKGKCFG